MQKSQWEIGLTSLSAPWTFADAEKIKTETFITEIEMRNALLTSSKVI